MTMGEDVPALRLFSRRSRHGVPAVAILFQLLVATLLLLTQSFDRVLGDLERNLDGVLQRVFAAFTQALSKTCAAQAALGPTSLVLYDVSTLYFETDKADGFREPGYSKERRLEPQITIGLLTDATGFPLAVHAFEGDIR